jgi:hypothetical protein
MYRSYVHRYFYLRGKLTYLRASHSRSSNDFLYHLHLVMSDQLWLPPSSAALPTARPAIRQHTSAYVSIRQHTAASFLGYPPNRPTCDTSAYVSIRQHTSAYGCLLLRLPSQPPDLHGTSSAAGKRMLCMRIRYIIRYTAYATHTLRIRIRYAYATHALVLRMPSQPPELDTCI